MHAKSTGELISFGFSDRSVRSSVSAKRSANRWDQTKKRLRFVAYLWSQSEFRTQRKSQRKTDLKSEMTQCRQSWTFSAGDFFVARRSNVLTTFGRLYRIRQNRLCRIWLCSQCVPGSKDYAFLPSSAGISFWDQISSARSQRSQNTLSGVFTRGLNQLMSYTPPVFIATAGGDRVGISWRCLMPVKLEWLVYRMVEKLWRYVKPFSSDTGT